MAHVLFYTAQFVFSGSVQGRVWEPREVGYFGVESVGEIAISSWVGECDPCEYWRST